MTFLLVMDKLDVEFVHQFGDRNFMLSGEVG